MPTHRAGRLFQPLRVFTPGTAGTPQPPSRLDRTPRAECLCKAVWDRNQCVSEFSGANRLRSPYFSNFPPTTMGTPGPLELIIIFAVVLLLFGAKRIPEIARGIGKGIREFKDATSEISRELESESQKRQINQPRAPQQGTPQARQSQQTPEPAPADDAGDETEPRQEEPRESDARDTTKETS